MNVGLYGFSNILELVRAVAFRATGKPGATAGAELAGGTTSGAPTSGEHVVGELVVDHSGTLWICTAAGTPGTWTQVVGGSGSYTLPAASTSAIGGVKPGSGLRVESDGTLDAGASLLTPPARTWRQSISPGSPTTVTTSTVIADGAFNGTPVMATTRTGTILVAWRDATVGPPAEGSAGDVSLKASTDGGATWGSESTIATHASGHDLQVFALVCLRGAPHGGRLLLAYWDYPGTVVGSAIYTMYSDDDGATWSSPAALTSQPYTSYSVGGGNIIECADGTLLLPVYGENSGDSAYRNGVMRSVDQGATWSSAVTIAGANSNYDEMNLVLLPDGSLKAFVRFESSTSGLYTATSTDSGATWSGLAGIGFSAWGGQPAVGLIPVSQMLVIFYRKITTQACVWRYSTDYGTTWSSETQINSNVWGYGSVVPLGDHLVGVVYADEPGSRYTGDLNFLTLCTGVPTISGSRSGNAALASLLSGLALEGEILDGTTAGTAPPSGLAVSHNGTAVATEAGLNLVDGSNVTLTVADNSGSSRVDVTVASTGSTVSSLLVLLPNPYDFVSNTSTDYGQPPDFITLASGDVIGCGGM